METITCDLSLYHPKLGLQRDLLSWRKWLLRKPIRHTTKILLENIANRKYYTSYQNSKMHGLRYESHTKRIIHGLAVMKNLSLQMIDYNESSTVHRNCKEATKHELYNYIVILLHHQNKCFPSFEETYCWATSNVDV